MTLFEVNQVTYRYREVVALDRLSLRIPAQRRIALLGANGSGKSTLLRLLDALDFAHAGEMRFCGELLNEARFASDSFALAFRRRVGFVFQNADAQLFNPTVFDEIAFAPLQLGWPKNELRDRVYDICERLRISHLKDRVPHRLSGGEKKRVALASILVIDPEVLLLDEPTAGLDPRSESQMLDFLIQWGNGTKSVVFATHDLATLDDIADYCYVLDQGRLAAEGAPREILTNAELLNRTNLAHIHRHRHASGEVHSHAHVHRQEH